MLFFNTKLTSSYYNGPLFPNCLITRYPLIFINKPKKLFSKNELWADIPSFTAEHGYEVHHIFIPDLKLQKCQNFLIENLKTFNSPTHIISCHDLNDFPELFISLNQNHLVSTWTQFLLNSLNKTKQPLFNYKLWINHLILLAELDFSIKDKACNLQKMKFDPY